MAVKSRGNVDSDVARRSERKMVAEMVLVGQCGNDYNGGCDDGSGAETTETRMVARG